jgi:hypothetical protein
MSEFIPATTTALAEYKIRTQFPTFGTRDVPSVFLDEETMQVDDESLPLVFPDFRSDPDVLVIDDPEVAFPNANSMMRLSLAFYNVHTTVARSPTSDMDDVAKAIFLLFVNSKTNTYDGHEISVDYLSVANEMRLARRHDRPESTKTRVYDQDLYEQSFKEEPKQKERVLPRKSLIKEQVEGLVFEAFSIAPRLQQKVLRKYIESSGLRLPPKLLDTVLSEVAVPKGRLGMWELSSDYAQDLSKDGSTPYLEEMRELAAKAEDEVQNILMYVDFEDRKIQRLQPPNVIAEGHSMYVSGKMTVEDKTFTFVIYYFRTGSLRVSIGFREGEYKDMNLDEVERLDLKKYVQTIIQWFYSKFVSGVGDPNPPSVDGFHVIATLRNPYFAEETEPNMWARRNILGLQWKRKLQYSLVGMKPVGSLESTFHVEGYPIPIGETNYYLKASDAIAKTRENRKKDESIPLPVQSYLKTHMDRWRIEMNPYKNTLGDVITAEQINYVSRTYARFIGAKVVKDTENPFSVALYKEVINLTPETRIPLIIVNLETQKFTVHTDIRDPRVQVNFRVIEQNVWKRVFNKPVPVTYWWKSRKFSIMTSDNTSERSDAKADMITVLKLMSHVIGRDGPGGLAPIVLVDQFVPDPDQSSTASSRKRGHQRKSAVKERPGKKQGTTCKPKERVPNPADTMDFETPCAPDPDSGNPRVVMPTKEGYPCCFEKPTRLGDAGWKKRILGSYVKYAQKIPEALLAFLGLTAQPKMNPGTQEYTFDFDKIGRIRINGKLAERLPVSTLVSAAKALKLPTVREGPRRDPIPSSELRVDISRAAFKEDYADIISSENDQEFFVGLARQLGMTTEVPEDVTLAKQTLLEAGERLAAGQPIEEPKAREVAVPKEQWRRAPPPIPRQFLRPDEALVEKAPETKKRTRAKKDKVPTEAELKRQERMKERVEREAERAKRVDELTKEELDARILEEAIREIGAQYRREDIERMAKAGNREGLAKLGVDLDDIEII